MNWFPSFLVALCTGFLGLLAAGLLAQAYVTWYRIGSFEGKSGFVVVGGALAGAIISFFMGLAIARFMETPSLGSGFFPAMVKSGITLVSVTVMAALILRIAAPRYISPEGTSLTLDFLIRLPEGESLSATVTPENSHLMLITVSGKTVSQTAPCPLDLPKAQQEENRWVIPAEIPMPLFHGNQILPITIDGQKRETFQIPLPENPQSKASSWSSWLPAPRPGDPPWPATKFTYRFRVHPTS